MPTLTGSVLLRWASRSRRAPTFAPYPRRARRRSSAARRIGGWRAPRSASGGHAATGRPLVSHSDALLDARRFTASCWRGSWPPRPSCVAEWVYADNRDQDRRQDDRSLPDRLRRLLVGGAAICEGLTRTRQR